MSQQRHIIGRTILELNTNTLADVWSLQEDVSQVFQQQAVGEIEGLFDRLVEPDQIVRFDRVVVNVGAIDPHNLLDEFPRQVVAELDRILSDRITTLKLQQQLTGSVPTSGDPEISIQDRSTADWEVLLSFLQYGRLPWWCPAGDWQGWFSRWEAALQRNRAWRQPMQILFATNPAARQRFVIQLPEEFRHQCLLQLQPVWIEWPSRLTQARRLIQSLGLSGRARHWLDTQAWVLLLAEIQPGSPVGIPLPAATWARNWIAQLVQTWRSQLSTSEIASPPIRSAPRQESSLIQEPIQSTELGSPSTSDSSPTPPRAQVSFEYMAAQRLQAVIKTFSASEQKLWLAAISTAIRSQQSQPPIPKSGLSPDSISPPAKTPIAESIESEAGVRRPLEDSPAQDTNALDSSSSDDLQEDAIEFRDSLNAASAQNSTDQATNASDSPKQTDTSELPPELIAFLKGGKTQPIRTPQASRSSLSSEEERSGIYITLAGLVLLHPFIQPYLDEVGLLDEALFRDDTAQQQAIYLLHYLATGQTRAPEPELVLPKLLCGWPLNDPVEPDLELPEAALAEGEHLLQTAIDYWQTLKNTGPDGLREGFLQRDGKLTRTDSGWKLRVEQKAIDILLSCLPWGLSMVRLPWMDELLTVEWT